jgi:glycerol-3-phosphate dehydrogenase (NAD(P)+)
VTIASKGIEEEKLELMSQVLTETMPDLDPKSFVFLSGPTFAREVASGLPTDVVAASKGMKAARRLQPWLHSPTFRVYTSGDPVGVEVGGAMKNVIAVAAGASDGLDLGSNARAALITRGLAEITRLGVALGADPLTFLGMSGVGDLVLTCTGDLSRNRTLGKKVAAGFDPEAYLASQRTVAEGFNTSAAAHALAQKIGVDMPITEQVYHVLHKRRPLLEALRILLTREYKEVLARRAAGSRRPLKPCAPWRRLLDRLVARGGVEACSRCGRPTRSRRGRAVGGDRRDFVAPGQRRDVCTDERLTGRVRAHHTSSTSRAPSMRP